MVYIYGLICPVAGVVRYIGKSINPEKRLRSHIFAALRGATNHHTARWIRMLHRDGLSPTVTILGVVRDGESWQEAERRHIAEALRSGVRLTNSTAGGEGLDYIRPEDQAQYIANLSASLKKVWSTPERRQQAKERSLKAWADPEVTARRLVSFKTAANRPDVKAKVSDAARRMWSRPEHSEKLSGTLKAYWGTESGKKQRAAISSDPAFLAEQAERLRGRWQDEAHRQKMQDARWTPEKRAEQAKRLADRREKILAAMTPDVRAKQAETLKKTWAKRKAQQPTA